MKKQDYFCSGEGCRLCYTCRLHQNYIKRKHEGKSLAGSLIPKDPCPNYEQIEYYGN